MTSNLEIDGFKIISFLGLLASSFYLFLKDYNLKSKRLLNSPLKLNISSKNLFLWMKNNIIVICFILALCFIISVCLPYIKSDNPINSIFISITLLNLIINCIIYSIIYNTIKKRSWKELFFSTGYLISVRWILLFIIPLVVVPFNSNIGNYLLELLSIGLFFSFLEAMDFPWGFLEYILNLCNKWCVEFISFIEDYLGKLLKPLVTNYNYRRPFCSIKADRLSDRFNLERNLWKINSKKLPLISHYDLFSRKKIVHSYPTYRVTFITDYVKVILKAVVDNMKGYLLVDIEEVILYKDLEKKISPLHKDKAIVNNISVKLSNPTIDFINNYLRVKSVESINKKELFNPNKFSPAYLEDVSNPFVFINEVDKGKGKEINNNDINEVQSNNDINKYNGISGSLMEYYNNKIYNPSRWSAKYSQKEIAMDIAKSKDIVTVNEEDIPLEWINTDLLADFLQKEFDLGKEKAKLSSLKLTTNNVEHPKESQLLSHIKINFPEVFTDITFAETPNKQNINLDFINNIWAIKRYFPSTFGKLRANLGLSTSAFITARFKARTDEKNLSSPGKGNTNDYLSDIARKSLNWHDTDLLAIHLNKLLENGAKLLGEAHLSLNWVDPDSPDDLQKLSKIFSHVRNSRPEIFESENSLKAPKNMKLTETFIKKIENLKLNFPDTLVNLRKEGGLDGLIQKYRNRTKQN